MEEIWKDVIGYEGLYQISNLGIVKSLSRMAKHFRGGERIVNEKKLKIAIDGGGYFHVSLCKYGKTKTKRIHQLVAMAFLNHINCGHKLVIDHINDDKTDNCLENLQIVTQRENSHKTQGKYSSKYKGVSWCKKTNKWASYIYLNGKLKYLGLFINEEEANNAYQNKLKTIQ